VKNTNMTWLLWKEYRQNRLIVFAMLFLLVMPYLVASLVLWKWGTFGPGQGPLLHGFAAAGMYSLILSQVIMALIGGNVIAGERIDRSAEFQAYQPIPRIKILSAKLLLVLVIVAAIWLPNAWIFWAAWDPLVSHTVVLAYIVIGGLTMFCVAWLLSSILGSPTLPVLVGLFTPLLIAWGIMVAADAHNMPENTLMEIGFPAICLTLAPICFALGTWLYLRRVEP
jgi:ABC-type transport system involved in multi-copper enzyme maturation permease subunit